MTTITRFAPSPTGFLHVGNMRTAIFNWLAATHFCGHMQLRLEDTDQARGQAHFADAIKEDLAWLGLHWTGATGADGEPWRQSARQTVYEAALGKLKEQTYHCFCSPEELAESRREMLRRRQPPRYSGKCAELSEAQVMARLNKGEEAAVRFRMPKEKIAFDDLVHGRKIFHGKDIGDFIVRRSDGSFSFFFTNAVDDADCGVSHVLRGDDHLANTPRQLALLAALAQTPPLYGHLGLMVGDDGPLSKRLGDLSVSGLRERGILPAALINYLARSGHRIDNSDLLPAEELAHNFNFSSLSSAPVRYDEAQLMRRQKEAVLLLSIDELNTWLSEEVSTMTDAKEFLNAMRDNLLMPADARAWVRIFEDELPEINDDALALIKEAGGEFYQTAATLNDTEEWMPFCRRVADVTKRRGRRLYPPLRAALCGRTDGPAMEDIFRLLGAQKTRARLFHASSLATPTVSG